MSVPKTVAVGTCAERWAAMASRSRAEIDGPAPLGEYRTASPRKFLALDPGYVDTPVHVQRPAAELQCAGYPGQRFPLLAPAKPRVERGQVGGGAEELVGLLLGGNAPCGDEAVDHVRGGCA